MDCSKLLLIFVISVAAVKGFRLNYSPEVSTSDYFLNADSSAIPSRHKRDTDGGLIQNAKLCCNEPKPSMKDDTNKAACMQEVSSRFSETVTEAFIFANKGSNETACFAECVLRKKNAIDDAGQINFKAAVDSLAECPAFKDQSLLDEVSTVCANLPQAKDGASSEAYVCKRAPMEFLQCAHDIKTLNCPAQYQIQSDTCKKFWEEVKTKH